MGSFISSITKWINTSQKNDKKRLTEEECNKFISEFEEVLKTEDIFLESSEDEHVY